MKNILNAKTVIHDRYINVSQHLILECTGTGDNEIHNGGFEYYL